MGGKSNTPGSTISLPQGGGALQGIGETFSPDLQTGTGNFSVPIALPPGRNGPEAATDAAIQHWQRQRAVWPRLGA